MSNKHFTLTTRPAEALLPFPAEGSLSMVAVPMEGRIPCVSLHQTVVRGECVGRHPTMDMGHVHASIDGEITGLSFDYAIITAKEPDGEKVVEPLDLKSFQDDDLLAAIRSLGLNPKDVRQAKTLVINGVSPEPFLNHYPTLLAHRRETLEKGLELARELVRPETVHLVLARGAEGTMASLDPVMTRPVHPMGSAALVARAALGNDSMDQVCVLALDELFALGTVAETGLPRTETVITVGDTCYLAPLGTPASELLAAQGLDVRKGDKMILGGPMCGRASYSTSQGISALDHGLMIVRKGAFPPTTDNPCINCGDCVLACPARLMPNFLSRYAEFGLYEEAEAAHLDLCFECGLCGYHCPVGRPMLQYIRLAKFELSCRARPEEPCEVETSLSDT